VRFAMSHFTSIRTQIKQVDALVKALRDVGFEQVEVHETAQHLYGFQGDVRSQTAEVIIRRQLISAASNDIGFKRQEDGTFQAIISEYDRKHYSQQWLNQVTQRYGYHALMATASRQGFTIEEDEVMEDGTLRVVVARWN
jgi:3-deoxy-D-arabino-heptulosonate 7-phosphate (DAHP) synthase